MILAGDPKQLPPTVLSLNKAKKEKEKEKKKEPKKKPETKAPVNVEDNSSDSDSDEDLEEKEVSPKPSVAKPPSLVPPRTLETTLFDRLEKMYGAGIKRMLTVQYR